MGEPPRYFVPGEPALTIGCARLGVSGKPVELSVDADQGALCLNPAYRGRHELGVFIPAICDFDRNQLHIVNASIPRQSVSGYRLVVWGEAPHPRHKTKLGSGSVIATAATFEVPSSVRERFGTRRPHGIFIGELPQKAACHPIIARARGAKDKVAARSGLCDGLRRQAGTP